MPDDTEQQPTSIAMDFANAFGAAGDETQQQAAQSQQGTQPGEQQAQQQSSASDKTAGGDDADPLKGLKLDDILKHPELGPLLNSWNDKTTNSRLASERAAGETVGVQKGQEQARAQSRDAFFRGLTQEELATELLDKATAVEYANWQAEQANRAGDEDAQTTARAAQVLAMGMAVSEYTDRVNASGLTDADKAKLLDVTPYTPKGEAGFREWTRAVNDALIGHEAEKRAASLSDENSEARRQQRQAEEDEQRPGVFRAPARRSGSAPDAMKTPTAKLFENAFGG